MKRIEYAAIVIPAIGFVAVIAAFLRRDLVLAVSVAEKPTTAAERLESRKEGKARQIEYETRQNAQKVDQVIKDMLGQRNAKKGDSCTPEDLGELDGFDLHYIFKDRINRSVGQKLMGRHDDSKVY